MFFVFSLLWGTLDAYGNHVLQCDSKASYVAFSKLLSRQNPLQKFPYVIDEETPNVAQGLDSF